MSKTSIPKEYLGAFKIGHRPHSQEFIDDEFSRDLLRRANAGCEESRKALEWLTKFNNEYHKDVVKKGDKEALHKTDEMRKDCHRRNYARRNDLYTSVRLVKNLSGI